MGREERKACETVSIRLDLFEGLEARQEQEFQKVARSLFVKKGAPLFVPGDPPDALYFLKSGRIKISRISPRGKELILDIVEPGETFGELGVLEGEPRETAGVALEDSCVALMPRSELDRLLRSSGSFAITLSRLMALRRQRLEKRLADFAFRDVSGRLASLLTSMMDRYGVPDPRGTKLRILLSQQLIANLIGASREIVNITLADFRRKGWIDFDDRRLVIVRRAALEEI